jgi:glycerol-3-phosphate acyltransferase PlsX
MHEHASAALRQYPESSIMVGMKLVKAGQLDAFVSAGNTGAFMAAAVFGLGLIEGVMRPTIGSLYPHQNKYSYFLDVGANVDAKPEQLAQFAQIGSLYAQTMMGVPQPKVALLNIGEEEGKGNQQAQHTYKLLQQTPGIHFIGNAEGRDFALGTADVYVCDGFVGNILLKFGESFYDLMKAKLPNDPDVEMLNLENVGAQPFLGVNGTVLIGHGISGPRAFCNMVRRAQEAVQHDLVGKLRSGLAALNREKASA